MSNEDDIAKLMPHEDATGKNVALGATGAFLIVPLFFMDFKDAEAIEIKALERRNRWLRELGAKKECDIPPSKFLGEVRACTEAKDADKPWVGNWVGKVGEDILAVDISIYQINGQLITSGGTYEVDGRIDDQGTVDAEITSSWANASLTGTFPELAARATGEKPLGAVKSEADTIFTLCN
ncbi:MAG: hypothetical protein OEU09_01580 [Rhodospirillales bacterium]|nr:hypothetical protein [Rhodospirillales bacterium]